MSNVAELRQTAEKCMRAGNYTEAFFHLTHAIKASGTTFDAGLHFQRSKCFLKQQQYYYALQDADELIRRGPDSHLQGYVRRAEIMMAVQDYAEAVVCYQKCFQLSHKDKDIFMDAVRRCKREMAREQSLDEQYPFVGAAIGIIVSVCGVAVDFVAAGDESLIASPILKVAVVILVSCTCLLFSSKYRAYMVAARKRLLDPPVDLFGEDDKKDK